MGTLPLTGIGNIHLYHEIFFFNQSIILLVKTLQSIIANNCNDFLKIETENCRASGWSLNEKGSFQPAEE